MSKNSVFRQYDQTVLIAPSARSIGILAGALMLAYQVYVRQLIPQVWIEILVAALFAVGCLVVIPAWINWIISMILRQIEYGRKINLIDDEMLLYEYRLELLDRQRALVERISLIPEPRLQFILNAGIPELEYAPNEGEFLTIGHNKRVPLEICRQIAAQWIELVNGGRNPWLLPPIRLWNNPHERQMVADVYEAMRDRGLLKVWNRSGDIFRGQYTAQVAPDAHPIQILQWMRLEGEYRLDIEDEDAD